MKFQGEKIQEALNYQRKARSTGYSGINLNISKDQRAGVGAALTTMADAHGNDAGGGGGDGGDGGDGGMEGGLFLDESIGNAILTSLTTDRPQDHCYFLFLRFIQKSLRVFYVSFFFYFAPFGMLLYQYYLNQQ